MNVVETSWRSWNWKVKLTTALAIAPIILTVLGNNAFAQITPDSTLGTENSVVTPNLNINGIASDRIDGGATRGSNLFHSFREFNIGEGRGAYFTNPAGIENLLSRVTGNTRSEILGTLGVLGNANLFFINPNGIIFGPNARLDLRGSFLASTASSFRFANGIEFSAINPQAPPLLTINVPTGLQYGRNPGNIIVQGLGQDFGLSGITQSFNNNLGLQVPAGQSLVLVGGNVSLDSAILQAPGGRIELGGLADTGTVELNPDWSLNFPVKVQQADVFMNNRAGINVIAGNSGGGSINIQAQNIDISGESLLTAGITSGLGTVDTRAGDITLNATGITTIELSRIENNVNFDTTGDSGDINIQTNAFFLTGGAILSTSNFGSGFGGDVTINANKIAVVDQSTIESTTSSDEDYNFSQVAINAPEGSVIVNQGTLNTTNTGAGFAGDIAINARDEIAIVNHSRVSSQGKIGRIFIGSEEGNSPPRIVSIDNSILDTSNLGSIAPEDVAINVGDIFIQAIDSIIIDNRSEIDAFTQRLGDAGNVTLLSETGDIFLGGGSLIFSTVQKGGMGDGGNIDITARSLFVTDGTQIQTAINTLAADPSGTRVAGNITIQASEDVLFAGFATVDISGNPGLFPSAAFSTVAKGAVGDAGNVDILAGRALVLTEQAGLTTNNDGTGLAGDIILNAGNQIWIGNQSTIFSDGEFGRIFIGSSDNADAAMPPREVRIESSTLSTTNTGSGVAGDITINAQNLVSIRQSIISGNGEFGRIFIGSSDNPDATISPRLVSIERSRLRTTNAGSSVSEDVAINAGDISIQAIDSIIIDNQSEIDAFTQRLGNAGNVTLLSQTGDIFLAGGSVIFSTVQPGGIGDGGNIDITARSLFVTDGAQIQTAINTLAADPSGARVAGNITIQATEDVLFAGFTNVDISGNPGFFPSGVRSDVEKDAFGSAGNINIDARSIFVINGAELTSNNNSSGSAGAITLNASNLVLLSNSGSITSTSNSDDNTEDNGNSAFGTISLTAQAGSVILTNQAQLDTTNKGSDFAGDIIINARDEIIIANESKVSSEGRIGRILIGSTQEGFEPPRVVRIDASDLSTANEDALTFAGDIMINARDQVEIVNGSQIFGDGRIGRILIGRTEFSDESSSPRTVLIDGSTLRTTNAGVTGADDELVTAGDIAIGARESIALVNESIIEAFTERLGDAGSVTFRVENGTISLTDGSAVFSTVEKGGTGNGGNIAIATGSLSMSDGAQVIASTSGKGNAGNVLVQADGEVLLAGSDEFVGFNTSIFSSVEADGSGNGGTIDIQAESLSLTKGAQLITIVRGADRENQLAAGRGNAGNIRIDIRRDISIDGEDSAGFSSGAFSTVQATAVGNGGSISIQAESLAMTNRAELSTSNAGDGVAGNIEVDAHSIRLNNQASVSSDTKGGQGNIMLRSHSLILRRGSSITTNATGSATGGNITINTDVLAALENSDINANAEESFGGRVIINTQGIFGTQFRAGVLDTPESDITASSALGPQFSGTVAINTPDVDPSRGLVALPQNFVDATGLIDQRCTPTAQQSEFIITGRGGLPSSPNEPLSGETVLVNLATLNPEGQRSRGENGKPSANSTTGTEIVEAQGWTINSKGEVVLTTESSTVSPYHPGLTPASCYVR